MPTSRFKIVFNGQLMPNASLEETKEKLANLFKSDPEKIEGLFNGSPVTLKRNLEEEEADKYLAVLHKAGAQARKETDLSESLSLVSIDSGEAHAADQPQMRCPKCDHEQVKAPVCAACGIVIEKFIARQAAQAEAAPTSEGVSPYSTPKAQVATTSHQYGELRPFGVTGRIGRVRYLAWSAVLMFAAVALYLISALFLALVPWLGGLLVTAVVIGALVVSVQIGVQRLHDMGWSGWLWLLNLVPLVGSVFAILMLVVPGNQDANQYGAPPPPNSTAVKVLAFGWLVIPVFIGILAAIAVPAYQDYVERAQQSQSQYIQPESDDQ